jgi:hypothetical protein
LDPRLALPVVGPWLRGDCNVAVLPLVRLAAGQNNDRLTSGDSHVSPTKIEAAFTAAASIDEVYEYLPALSRKKRLQLDTLLLTLAALLVTGTLPSPFGEFALFKRSRHNP